MNPNPHCSGAPRSIDFSIENCTGAAGGVIVTNTHDHVVVWCMNRASAVRQLEDMCASTQATVEVALAQATALDEACCALCRTVIDHHDQRASALMSDAVRVPAAESSRRSIRSVVRD